MQKEAMEFQVNVAYVLGAVSIILPFINALAGLATSILGILLIKKNKEELALKTKKLATIGLVLNLLVLVIAGAAAAYAAATGQLQTILNPTL